MEVDSLLEIKILWKKNMMKKFWDFYFIAVYLLHLVDFVESVLIHVNEYPLHNL